MRFIIGIALVTLMVRAESASPRDSLEAMLNMSLEELMNFEVITPTHDRVALNAVPGSVTLITREQILKSPAQTIPELLRGIPGVNVRWNPMVQTIDIRGFGSNPFTSRILLLIDGVPYNSWNKGGFPQHPGFDFFNLDYVEHIEVLRGRGSALYGKSAFSGVINIVTLSGDNQQVNRVRALAGDDQTVMASVTQGWQFGTEGSFLLGARKFEGIMPTEFWDKYGTGKTDGYDLFTKLKWRGWELTYYRIDDQLDGFVLPLGRRAGRQ
ncbi:MAG: TonB-dependent receptor plug domain-containing protein [Pseudomonadales bacterium]